MENSNKSSIILLGTADVCKLLHIGRKKCLQLFHSDEFPSIYTGKKFLIKEDCLNEFLSHKRMLVR